MLLVLSVAAPLTLPSGFGQGWITATSLSTFTTTRTEFSYYTAGSSYVTSIQSLDYEEPSSFWDVGADSFYLPGRSEYTQQYCGVYDHLTFQAAASEKIHIEMQSSGKVTFAVMSEKQFRNWQTHMTCAGMASLVYQGSTTSFSRDWVVPENGLYYFVFLNIMTTGATITFKAGRAVQTPYPIYSTLAKQNVATVTGTSIYTTQESLLPTTGPSSIEDLTRSTALGVIGIGLPALVVLLFLYFREPKARRTTIEKPRVTREARVLKKESRGQFCIECGARLPPKSKFCNKCGSPQQ